MTALDNYFSRIESNNNYFAGASRAGPPERQYEKAFDLFVARLPRGGTVVGLGSGDGRHLLPFVQRGFQVLGVDPSPDRRAIAKSQGVESIDGTFENLRSRNLSQVDGVWCSASFRHVPENYIIRALRHVAEILKSGGVLFLTTELGNSFKWVTSNPPRDKAESLNQQVLKTYLTQSLTQQGLLILERWYPTPTSGRSGDWIAVIAAKA